MWNPFSAVKSGFTKARLKINSARGDVTNRYNNGMDGVKDFYKSQVQDPYNYGTKDTFSAKRGDSMTGVLGGIEGVARANPYAAGAIGAGLAGGIYGAMSDNTSVLGGMAMGAGVVGASKLALSSSTFNSMRNRVPSMASSKNFFNKNVTGRANQVKNSARNAYNSMPGNQRSLPGGTPRLQNSNVIYSN